MSTLATTFQSRAVVCEDSAPAIQKDQKKLNPVNPDLIRTLLEVSPEMQLIDNLLDKKCYFLHKDEKLGCFSELFKEIISINKELFASKTVLEKANILFGFHLDAITHQISPSEKLTFFIESFFQRLEVLYKTPEVKRVLTEETEKKMKERISYLHSSYIRFATATALEVPIKDISSLFYPDDSGSIGLKKPSNMGLYKE